MQDSNAANKSRRDNEKSVCICYNRCLYHTTQLLIAFRRGPINITLIFSIEWSVGQRDDKREVISFTLNKEKC